MPVPPRRPAAKKAPAKAAPAAAKAAPAKTPGKLRSAGGTVKYDYPMQQYLDREPTKVHQNFVAWVKEQTGYDADPKTVQLAFVLRINFQKSEFNQEDLGNRRAAAAEKKTEKPVAKKGPAGPVARRGVAKKAPAAPVEESAEEVENPADEVEEVEEAPKAPARKRAATKAPAKTPAKAAPPARARKTATRKATAPAAEEEAF